MHTSRFSKTALATSIALALVFFSSGCSTITGIPSHGGGKRFAVEQRLISASIRSTLKNFDVSALRGRKVALIFDIISDEGGGNLSGGRFNLFAGLTSGYLLSPVTSTNSQFQIYSLAQSGTNYNNTVTNTSGQSATTTGVLQYSSSTGSVTSSRNSQTNSSSNSSDNSQSESRQNTTSHIGETTTTQQGTNSGTSTTDAYVSTQENGSSTSVSRTDPVTTVNNNGAVVTTINNSGATITNNNPRVTSVTTTGNVTTTQVTDGNTATQVTSPSQVNQTTGAVTNTTQTGAAVTTVNHSGSTTTNTMPSVTSHSQGSSSQTATTSASVNTTETNGTSNSSSNSSSNGQQVSTSSSTENSQNSSSMNSDSTTNSNSSENRRADSNGGDKRNVETFTPSPVSSQQVQRGNEKNASFSIQYRGIGEYQNLQVPKSDASLLMGLVRNYLLLNGVEPTVPNDPEADAILYITVDVFGIVRSRFDAYAFNRESVIAETAIEMMAFDRSGRLIMAPSNANYEAKYDENYFFWAGPFVSEERVREGKGLLVDFSDVDGQRANYPSKTERKTYKHNSM